MLGALGLGLPTSLLACKREDSSAADAAIDELCPLDASEPYSDAAASAPDLEVCPHPDAGSGSFDARPDEDATTDAGVSPDGSIGDASTSSDAAPPDALPEDTGPPCDESADGGSSASPPGPPRARNVLLIVVDDLNSWIHTLGGHPQARTPNLDRLAAMGLSFTNAHTSAPECNAARVAMFTGFRPSSTGVYDNTIPFRTVRPDAVTLFEAFRAGGYSVAGGGKIFHFTDAGSFETYFSAGGDPVPPASMRPINGIPGATDFDWGPLDVPDERMGDARLASWAEQLLSAPSDRPFVLAAGLQKPHLPFYVPRAYFDLFPISSIVLPEILANDLDDVPPSGVALAAPNGDHARVVAAGQWAAAVQGYLASIAFADAMVGRLLDALASGPNAEDTLIVLTTDHGWHLGEKLHWRKFALWEEATRVPLIVAGPGIPRGTTTSAPVSTLDVYPTLVEWMGLARRPELEGRCLVPLLEDPTRPFDGVAVSTWGVGNHSVRTDRFRYIRYASGQEELYDHSTDPHEWRNLAAEPSTLSTRRALRAHVPQDLPFCRPR